MYPKRAVKHVGESIRLLGCFSTEETGRVIRIKEEMNGAKSQKPSSNRDLTGMTASTAKYEAMVLDRRKVVFPLWMGGVFLPQVEELCCCCTGLLW